MAKVGRDDKERVGPNKVGRQELAVQFLLLACRVANHDGNDLELAFLALHDFGKKGELHFDAVLVLVRLDAHVLEFAGLVELIVDLKRANVSIIQQLRSLIQQTVSKLKITLLVDDQIVQRRLVLRRLSQGGSSKSVVMRRTQYEHGVTKQSELLGNMSQRTQK